MRKISPIVSHRYHQARDDQRNNSGGPFRDTHNELNLTIDNGSSMMHTVDGMAGRDPESQSMSNILMQRNGLPSGDKTPAMMVSFQ